MRRTFTRGPYSEDYLTGRILPDEPAARGAVPSGRVIRFAVVLPMVAKNDCADHRSGRAKPNTRHEVTAARVGRFLLLEGWRNFVQYQPVHAELAGGFGEVVEVDWLTNVAVDAELIAPDKVSFLV